MITVNLSNPLDIKPYPIRQLTIFLGEWDSPDLKEVIFEGSNLLDESNIAIEPVTARNSAGGAQALYYKATGSIYIVTDNRQAIINLDAASKQAKTNALIRFGGTGSFDNETDTMLTLYDNNGITIATTGETTQGWWRYIIRFDNIYLDNPATWI